MFDINSLSPSRPVLIAGATASGKSSLALAIAEAQGGRILNADALQVYDGWRILTARPGKEDEARAPHALYGHVPFEAEYSVGAWLRDLTPLLDGPRPIIVGGTGLYFRALTEGLAEIPSTPPAIREEADALPFDQLLSELDQADPVLAARIDRQNRARVQRGWEVWRATGRPLSGWQAETASPLLPLDQCQPLLLDADREWLNARIETRFDKMLEDGALDEARANLPRWSQAGGSAKAIGAPDLIAHLQGHLSLEDARTAAILASRQYAKRQRTWFRARMKGWQHIAQP
ncbi:tRNA (adenosine(37)-N6)-dimethylallyltransferase MiaA [Roseobacter sp. HKCCD9010]|uniref:tRNA (adenosine(37)-N6)-dimethylallyltransferase MiaA n=1 Tax=unclassified Roseobacter TaxID=196798 RepID=UPI00149130F1|nr:MULTISPECIES: tRNA (adenosine(37)-N6)-dimethylallyltransferase MiaA [unclassified Roseobacter]MBF9050554.1 tRNA (adenosine(37)-N6)-dimethylallyltransferase MiaA [Rhodobacterales bacterium HKCCD4356]NNV12027.1 tRNA (adenosine(37)-N6)-dimethylallyltransferase MiaA [Roseobacter sp. HKCCD7357]NNV17041.1 tRNA (adenosine(37)-N6)-dimethylallyltransferase MiaA [Roseobacter sp. HKCCD8768]NNV26270.1 tRNA (adenosine(37)-N6)-dimethylallyltransferase MiaA [Roseobacter sp. HKCCD8192]NNV30765.1 tRNA (aden